MCHFAACSWSSFLTRKVNPEQYGLRGVDNETHLTFIGEMSSHQGQVLKAEQKLRQTERRRGV